MCRSATVANVTVPETNGAPRHTRGMTKTLITGANKGLGYEAAKRLVAEGHEVWVGARDTKLGEEAARTLNARFVQLDVTDDASVEAAAALVAEIGGLDVLVNNAGIADRTPVVDTAASDVLRVLETNVLGPVRLVRAFTSILEASRSPVVVNVSSGVGSLTLCQRSQCPYSHLNLLAYPTSKAGLNMLTIQWARAHPRWRVNSADPGFTATDLNQHRGPRPSRRAPTRSSGWRRWGWMVLRAPSQTATVPFVGDPVKRFRKRRTVPRPLEATSVLGHPDRVDRNLRGQRDTTTDVEQIDQLADISNTFSPTSKPCRRPCSASREDCEERPPSPRIRTYRWSSPTLLAPPLLHPSARRPCRPPSERSRPTPALARQV